MKPFQDEDFRRACQDMSLDELQANALSFTEKSQDRSEPIEKRNFALWLRGVCQQQLGRNAGVITEAISSFESASRDFQAAVAGNAIEFAHEMASSNWFPEHAVFVPAYIKLIEMGREDPKPSLERAAKALSRLGAEAVAALPALEAARNCGPIFGPHIEAAIRRISGVSNASQKKGDGTTTSKELFLAVEEQLQIYPVAQDRFDLDHELTDEDLTRSETEHYDLLDHEHWAVRAKSACILRFTVPAPKRLTLMKLLQHLGPNEGRGIVRGQCALTLAQYASAEQQDRARLIQLLQERLETDSSYAVQGIAGRALARIGSNSPEVIALLTSALEKATNVNLQRALVEALGDCGRAAEAALPLVLRFTPHPDDTEGKVVKATAIWQIGPEDHPATAKSLNVIGAAVRWQPSSFPTTVPRLRRTAGLNAVCRVSMDETLRRKLLLERMYLDEAVELRLKAARALIEIDKELAKTSGAYLVVARYRGR